MIIGSATGIYTAQRGKSGEPRSLSNIRALCNFRTMSDLTEILSITSPTSIYTLQGFNKVIIHHNNEIISYSLDMIARFSLGGSSRPSLESTYEKVSGNEGNVLFCKPGVVGKRTMRKLLVASPRY